MNIKIRERNGEKAYKVAFPVGVHKTHEGGLDQAKVVLPFTSKQEAFEPFSKVPFFQGQSWVVARDDVVRYKFNGKATHTLMLLEASKWLERVVCGAKTFTKPLINEYAPIPVDPYYQSATVGSSGSMSDWEDIGSPTIFPENVSYRSPLTRGDSVEISSDISWGIATSPGAIINTITGTSVSYSKDNVHFIEVDGTIDLPLYDAEILTIEYKGWSTFTPPGLNYDVTYYNRTIFKITVADAVSKDPLTVFEVVDRLLCAAEMPSVTSINTGQRNYVHLSEVGSYGDYISNVINTKEIVSPEFAFANGSTLKENLDEIAKVLHAKAKVLFISTRLFVYFTPLTSQEKAMIKGTKVSNTTAYDAEKYGGRVETNAANLIIANGAEGAVVEPCLPTNQSDYIPMKSVRCSDTQVRINEETGEIQTSFPIRRITKLYMSNLADGSKVDISKYVNELTRYNSLSSYENTGGRSYSLYYVQGEKNVRGLFFKAQTAASTISPWLERYAIVNIFNDATGSDWPGIGERVGYANVAFNIEYEPYLDVRLIGSRADGKGGSLTYIANQGANVVDKDSLSAFVRGTAEQMNADSPVHTFIIRDVSLLPNVGEKYDATHYISSVSYEIYPYFTKASYHLSEHYNKYGSRVQVANQVRQYEIDTKNVYQRAVSVIDTCQLSFTPITGNTGFFMGGAALRAYDHLQDTPSFSNDDISVSVARCVTTKAAVEKNMLPLYDPDAVINTVDLPVVSFGFANSLVFIFRYEDNFSAGKKSRLPNEDNKNLAYQDYAKYGDEYGDAEYIGFTFANGKRASTDLEDFLEEARNYPEAMGDLSSPYFERLVPLFKDAREAITVVYQIIYQSSDVIMTSDFFAKSPLVCADSNYGATILYYDVDEPFNPVTGETQAQPIDEFKGPELKTDASGFYLDIDYDPPEHKAFAITNHGKTLLAANRPFSPIYLSHYSNHL